MKIIILAMKRSNLILTIFTIFVILGFQITQVEATVRILPPPSVLPTARGMTTAIWDGNNAYIFGGFDTWFLDDIVKFNPATGTVTLLSSPSVLPTARYGTSAVWDGSNVYIFGGYTPSGYLNDIVQFNPTTGTVTLLPSPSVLPTARGMTSAVWDGNNAYIFGGDDASGLLNDIVQFNPTTGIVTLLPSPSVLPTARDWTSAIWDGSNAYIFGGTISGGILLNDIVQFNPTTGTVTLLPSPSVLPTPSWWTSAIWDGSNAYIFGGDNTGHGVPKWNMMNYIVQFNPTTGTVYVLSFPDILPTGRGVTSAIWDGRNAYIFGGSDDYSDALNDIVLFSPPEPLIGKRSAVVGGFMTPANKLAILAPYMTLLIFFEITLAIYIIRLKRKP
jgi:hypothetical protein